MPDDTAHLLRLAKDGDTAARDLFIRRVYDELHRLARRQRLHAGGIDTVNTTALVHEAYVKLMGRPVEFRDRRHFFGFAARAMRDVLVDHARAQSAAKRGGEGRPLSIDSQIDVADVPPVRIDEVIALHSVLSKLESVDEDAASVVELRYFGGLTIAEIAEVLGSSERTVKRRWTMARAWLYQALSDPSRPEQDAP